MDIPKNLLEIAERTKETGEPHKETVRTLLSWFDQQRRGRWVVSRIRSALRELDLTTNPDFETAYVDGQIEILSTTKRERPAINPHTEEAAEEIHNSISDPVARVRMLAAANKPPVSVTKNDQIADAMTEMLMNDFSQLPVMQGERTVDGVISWRSIGKALALNNKRELVKDCVEEAEIISADMPLLAAISSIVNNEVVLVRDTDKRITGLVTTSDVSLQFRELAEPFLLVGEIENHLRRIIDGSFSADELAAARIPEDNEREIGGVEDLSFGEYIRLLEPDSNWQRLKLRLDRKRVLKRLNRVRIIRNDVMHFSPDGTSPDDLEFLRDSVRFMQCL